MKDLSSLGTESAAESTSYYPTPPRIGDQQILGGQKSAQRDIATKKHSSELSPSLSPQLFVISQV